MLLGWLTTLKSSRGKQLGPRDTSMTRRRAREGHPARRMIARLTVLHARKEAFHRGLNAMLPPRWHGKEVLRLETCQRWLWVDMGHGEALPIRRPLVKGVDGFTGVDAYEFLLRVTTGLASDLAGETNILGQVKKAWAHAISGEPWLQWLLEDSKVIRHQFLSGHGTPSYGKIVREVLNRHQSDDSTPILVLGAGEIAEAILPWIRHRPVLLGNRHPGRAADLARRLADRPGQPISVVDLNRPEASWQQAGAVVVCIPFDPEGDACRVQQLSQRTGVRVIHLGGARANAGPWTQLAALSCLDELLALQEGSNRQRLQQLHRAAQACRERARLRALGRSISIPHGWEDLAHFVMPTPACHDAH